MAIDCILLLTEGFIILAPVGIVLLVILSFVGNDNGI